MLHKLKEHLGDLENILILTHDNPDPDAMGSAYGCAYLLKKLFGKTFYISFSGVVGRAENREMIKVLDMPFRHLDNLDLENFDGYILVDTQPESGNNSLPQTDLPVYTIDHHPEYNEAPGASNYFCDIRSQMGSSSTIVYEYLQSSSFKPSEEVSTALFYGIRTDTLDLSRDHGEKDKEAYIDLFLEANKQALARISNPPLSKDYFKAFRESIDRSEIYDDLLFTSMGDIHHPDIISEIADLNLRLRGINWSVCCGFYKDDFHISLRSREYSRDAWKILRAALSNRGTAGGHKKIAGGKIRDIETNILTRKELIKEILNTLLDILHIDKTATGYIIED